MNVFGWSVIFISAANMAHAQAIPNDLQVKDITLRNSFYVNSDEARTRAILSKHLTTAQSLAEINPYVRDKPQLRKMLYQHYLERGRAEAGLDKWQGGTLETAARASSAGLFAVGTMFTSPSVVGAGVGAAGGVIADAAITNEFKNWDTANYLKMSQIYTPEQTLFWNNVADFYLKKDPAVKDFTNDLDIGPFRLDPDQDKTFQQVKELGKIKDDVQALQKVAQEWNDSKARFEGMLIISSRSQMTPDKYGLLLKEANNQLLAANEANLNQLRAINKSIFEQIKQQELAIERDHYTGPFIAMSLFARIMKDDRAAHIFDKAANLSGAIFELSKATPESLQANPYKYVNIYLLIASTTIDMFGESHKTAEFAALMDSLKNISQQVEELRVQMHRRFDRLEAKLDHYFFETFIDLNRIHESQVVIKQALVNLSSEFSSLQSSIELGLDAIARNELLKVNAKCMGQDVEGNFLPLSSDKLANECFSAYVAFGMGNLQNLIKPDETELESRSFPRLVDTVSIYTSGVRPAIHSPFAFQYGTTELAKLMNRNPSYIPVALSANWNDLQQTYNYTGLVQNGQDLDKFHETMTLASRPFGGNRLRREIFEDLLEKYRSSANQISNQTHSNSVAILKGIPDPALKWSRGGPQSPPTNFPFLNGTISLCKQPLTKVNLSGWKEDGFTFVEHVDQRMQRTYAFDEQFMKPSENILKMLPASVQWIDYLGQKVIPYHRLYACFDKANIEQLAMTGYLGKESKIRISFGLNIHLAYGSNEKDAKDVIIAHISGDNTDTTKFFDPAWSPGIIRMAWTGVPDPDTGVRIMKSQDGKEFGFMNARELLRLDAATPEIQKELQEFEKTFSDILDVYKPRLVASASGVTKTQRNELDSIRWQLFYLLRQGVSMGHMKAQELYQKMFNSLPSGDAYLNQAVYRSPSVAFNELDIQINELKQYLKDTARDVLDFQPPASLFSPYVDLLNAYQNQPKKKKSWLQWIWN